MGLTLGGIRFTDFELPSNISFGGDQTVAVHRLQGGARVIDALGPDDAEIRWSGIISGPDATVRAQMLDQLRISGAQALLAWDSFTYTVIISHLSFSFTNSWWIPYRVSCIVAADPRIQVTDTAINSQSAVIADLMSAGYLIDVSAALEAVTSAGSAGAGSAAFSTASIALSTAYKAASTSLEFPDWVNVNGVEELLNAAAGVAAAGAARGYLARAIINYSQVG